MDYVAEAVIDIAHMRERLGGYKISSAPTVLRHFTASFEPLTALPVVIGDELAVVPP